MSIENARIILYGLLDECPFYHEENCPIKDMRKEPDEKKKAWARSLPLETVNEIVEYHERCFWERMAKEKD